VHAPVVVKETHRDQGGDKRRFVAVPSCPEADVDIVEPGQIAVVGVVQRPPPEIVQMPNDGGERSIK